MPDSVEKSPEIEKADIAGRPSAHAYQKSRALAARAHDLIPGGAHTYAKGDDQYPVEAPGFIARGLGCRVWDVDGNEFIEYGMGLRAVTLGHAHPTVNDAAVQAMQAGLNFTRPAAIEVACAERFLSMVPAADMVKFTKDGSTATTAAVKLARAHTGRTMVAYCADQPFFSYDDWFIGTTEVDGGIPESEKRLVTRFRYDDLHDLRSVFDRHPGQIAAVIMEAARLADPAPGYLAGVRTLCDEMGAVLIFDELMTGFRWSNGGAQAVYGVAPDLSCFGKAMANGFSLSALAGKRDLMELGGLRTDRRRVFLLSTTHGAETSALGAAMATMDIYRSKDVIGRLYRAGERLRTGVEQLAQRHGVADQVTVAGRDPAI